MPMWVSCHKVTDRVSKGLAGGFSLLELLVVLALISFMTALVVPRLKNTVDAISRSGDRAQAIRQLERLPLLVRRDGVAVSVDKGQDIALPGVEFPQGWKVQALDLVQVATNGYCHEARLDVTSPGGRERWLLGTPDCRISDGQ